MSAQGQTGGSSGGAAGGGKGSVGQGGEQPSSPGGFAAGAQQDSAPLTQGLSSQDMAAMQAAGVDLAGPGTSLSPGEAAVMQPESMGGKGTGGAQRAAGNAAAGSMKPAKNTPKEGGSLYTSDAPPSIPPDIANLFSAVAALGGTEMPMMAEGGTIAPGGSAVVGEAGEPEVVTAAPDGGARVSPMRAAAAPPQQSFLKRAGKKIGDIAIGAAVGQKGASAILEGRREASMKLATLGIQNPTLLRTSPNVVQAVDSAFGAGTADQIVQQGDPNVQARAMAQILGVDILPPGTARPDGTVAPGEMVQLSDHMARFGTGVQWTSKGEMRFNRPPRSAEQQDAIQAAAVFDTLKTGHMDRGLSENAADVAAAKRTKQIGAARGWVIPKHIEDMASADTTTKIEAARAGAKEFATQTQKLEFAGPKAFRAETAKREARIATPINVDEIRVADENIAQATGGVAYGREMKDEDLINADEQGYHLVQTPSGTFVGVPKDKLGEGQTALVPSELLSRRVAQKIAGKKTTQQQNAKIVLDAIDAIDDLDSLRGILQPAAAQGKSLGSQVLGAARTEVRGQTAGRLTLFAARRSPDPKIREQAISLINLNSLVVPVVKALGDVGAISEGDKKIFYDRLNRIANATASIEEGQTQLQQLRSMMMALASTPNAKKGSAESELLKDYINGLVTGTIKPGTPPPGYKVLPGTGAFYQITP